MHLGRGTGASIAVLPLLALLLAPKAPFPIAPTETFVDNESTHNSWGTEKCCCASWDTVGAFPDPGDCNEWLAFNKTRRR